MYDDIQTLTLDARRRREHSFRQLEVLLLQERLAALIGPEPADSGAQRIDLAKIPGEPRIR